MSPCLDRIDVSNCLAMNPWLAEGSERTPIRETPGDDVNTEQLLLPKERHQYISQGEARLAGTHHEPTSP